MQIGENDIIVLDFIIDKIIESRHPIWLDALIEEGYLKTETEIDRGYEFKRLISAIDELNCGTLREYPQTNSYSIERNEHTLKFKERGGFKKYCKDELEKIERENEKDKLETDLAKSNLEANKLNKLIAYKNDKNEKKNTIGMWVNISIGVLNIVLIAIQIWLSSQRP